MALDLVYSGEGDGDNDSDGPATEGVGHQEKLNMLLLFYSIASALSSFLA